MRFVVIGLGGVGGTIAAKLHLAGESVVGVARGAHLTALRSAGLRFVTPDGTEQVRFPVTGAPTEIDFGVDDVVVLAVKGQDTAGVLAGLRDRLPPEVPLVSAQNGVENERLARRLFPAVYGLWVILPGTHLRPGEVIAQSAPVYGQLDIGRYPSGTDEFCDQFSAALRTAGFDSRVVPDILRWKYGKLRMNLANAAEALCGHQNWAGELSDRLRDEADRVFAAGGIAHASEQELADRMAGGLTMRSIPGAERGGNSTWQSVTRGTGETEVDQLNGEITLLGGLTGVPTPANTTVVRLLHRLAAEHGRPGSRSVAEVLAEIDRLG